MACYRKTGKRNIFRATAGSALAKGDILQMTEATGSRTVDNAASDSAVLGICDAAISSAATGLVDVLSPSDQVWVQIQTGTMSATEVGKFADISDETGITLTESNNDFLILGWDGKTTSWCYGVFEHLNVSVGT